MRFTFYVTELGVSVIQNDHTSHIIIIHNMIQLTEYSIYVDQNTILGKHEA